jgi:hypothetical protein
MRRILTILAILVLAVALTECSHISTAVDKAAQTHTDVLQSLHKKAVDDAPLTDFEAGLLHGLLHEQSLPSDIASRLTKLKELVNDQEAFAAGEKQGLIMRVEFDLTNEAVRKLVPEVVKVVAGF